MGGFAGFLGTAPEYATEAWRTALAHGQESVANPGGGSGFGVLMLVAFLLLLGGAALQWMRLRKLQARLGASEYMRVAFDEAEEPILVLRSSLRVSEANLAAAAIFGFEEEELRGMPLRALLSANAFPRFQEAFRRVLRTSREAVDVTLRSQDAVSIPARAILRLLHEKGEKRLLVSFRLCSASAPPEPVQALHSGSETSEEDMTGTGLRDRESAEHLQNFDSKGPLAYLSNLGHEMRTQLTGILGFAEVLEEELTGRQKETAQLVRRSGQRLLHTINEILMLSRLEAGRVRLHPHEVDVTAEIAEEVQLLLHWAEEKGLGLHVRQPVMPVIARVDPGAFRRVLENLLSNAIKYTEQGTVEIGVKTDAEHLYLTVTDTGIGISPEFMPHLFEEFTREASGVTGREEGTGLGLAITERLVRMMGGEIHVESKPGEGTRFLVIFPLQLEESAEA